MQNKELLISTVGLQNNCLCITYLVARTIFLPHFDFNIVNGSLNGWLIHRCLQQRRARFLMQLNLYAISKPSLVCSHCLLIMVRTNPTSSLIKRWLRGRNCSRSYIFSFIYSQSLLYWKFIAFQEGILHVSYFLYVLFTSFL